MAAKNRITTNLDEKDYKDIADLSKKLDVSLAWLGRRAFSELIEKYRSEKDIKQDVLQINKTKSLDGS